jgi:type I site-specific restriction-modification system R (restriction) subunit
MTAGTALVPVAGVAEAVDAVSRQVAEAEARASALQVSSEAEANAAGTILREIQQRRKAAEAKRKDLTGPLLESKRRIDQEFKDAMAPFDAADKIVREKLGTYTAEQERIRQEEEARLERERQERERKAREERERQEAAERAKREQAEKEAREAEDERRRAQNAADAEAAEKLAEEARQKADEAKTAEAAIASLPEPTLPKAVVPAAPKPEGVSSRKRWVVKSIVLTALPDDYKIADEKAINAAMRDGVRENGQPPQIPGVMFEQVDELAVRA